MDKEQQLYLPPQEQLIIASKVNRLCEVSVDEFDPKTQVKDAEEIVKALHPRMKAFDGPRIKFIKRSTSRSNVLAGETGLGQINTSFDSEELKVWRFGIEEYKIGGYVAKLRSNPLTLEFEYFWSRGEINSAFLNNLPITFIFFREDYNILSIYREQNIANKIISVVSLLNTHRLELYPKNGAKTTRIVGVGVSIQIG